jgi:ribosomal protein L19
MMSVGIEYNFPAHYERIKIINIIRRLLCIKYLI